MDDVWAELTAPPKPGDWIRWMMRPSVFVEGPVIEWASDRAVVFDREYSRGVCVIFHQRGGRIIHLDRSRNEDVSQWVETLEQCRKAFDSIPFDARVSVMMPDGHLVVGRLGMKPDHPFYQDIVLDSGGLHAVRADKVVEVKILQEEN